MTELRREEDENEFPERFKIIFISHSLLSPQPEPSLCMTFVRVTLRFLITDIYMSCNSLQRLYLYLHIAMFRRRMAHLATQNCCPQNEVLFFCLEEREQKTKQGGIEMS